MQIIGSLFANHARQMGKRQFRRRDYGVIPGTKTDLCSNRRGKLALLFGLTVTAHCVEKARRLGEPLSIYLQSNRFIQRPYHPRSDAHLPHREKKYAYVWVTRRPTPRRKCRKKMLEEMKARWGSPEWVNKQKNESLAGAQRQSRSVVVAVRCRSNGARNAPGCRRQGSTGRNGLFQPGD